VGTRTKGGALEAPRCDTHDGERIAVDDERRADHPRVGPKTLVPERMAQHDRELAAKRAVIVGAQQAAQCRLHAEDGEVGTRHQHALAAQGASPVRQIGVELAMGRDVCERSLAALQVPEHRVAEDRVGVAGLVHALRARLGSGRQEVDETFGLVDGQRPQQQLLEQREDCDVGSDAERERHNRHGGNQGSTKEGASRQPDPAHGCPFQSVSVLTGRPAARRLAPEDASARPFVSSSPRGVDGRRLHETRDSTPNCC
jgi:hypothetical protein